MIERLGMNLPLRGIPLSQHGPWLRRLADQGYTDLWTQEVGGLDAHVPLAYAAGLAPELRLGTSITSVFTRGPALLAMEAAGLAEAAPGRFVLGLGASSPGIVKRWNGLEYERPYTRVAETLRFLRRALAGETVDFAGEQVRSSGFTLERPPEVPPPIYLGALGPRMLELAATEADGVLLSMVTPDDVRQIVDRVRAATPKGAPAREVVLRIGVVPSTGPEAERMLRTRLATYLSIPPYAGLHDSFGRGEELAPLRAAFREGDLERAAAAVPVSLLDGILAHGEPEACVEQVQRFLDAGLDTPIVSFLPFEGDLGAAIEAFGALRR